MWEREREVKPRGERRPFASFARLPEGFYCLFDAPNRRKSAGKGGSVSNL